MAVVSKQFVRGAEETCTCLGAFVCPLGDIRLQGGDADRFVCELHLTLYISFLQACVLEPEDRDALQGRRAMVIIHDIGVARMRSRDIHQAKISSVVGECGPMSTVIKVPYYFA